MLQHVHTSHHHNHSRSARLHPGIYSAIIGLAAWLALSAWGFSGSDDDSGASLTVVTGLVLMSIGLPTILWLIGHKYRQPRDGKARRSSLHDWLFGDFEVWQTHLKGFDAAVGILLPIAAVSIGMTIFAIVRHLAVGG